MALNDIEAIAGIVQVLNDLEDSIINEGQAAPEAKQQFAEDLVAVFKAYIESGTVNTTVTGSTTGGNQLVNAIGEGRIT